jgi:hypothetical protein
MTIKEAQKAGWSWTAGYSHETWGWDARLWRSRGNHTHKRDVVIESGKSLEDAIQNALRRLKIEDYE